MSRSASLMRVSRVLLRSATVPLTRLAEASSRLSSASREAIVRDSRVRPLRAAFTWGGLSLNSLAMTLREVASWSVSMRSAVCVRSVKALTMS